MKNILIYFPYNQRTVEQQSVMELFVKKGHNVFLLTLTPKGFLHHYVEKLNIKASASPVTTTSKIRNILQNAKFLFKFCKENNIDIIMVHQQLAALPLIFAKPFIKARLYYVRHNADEDYLSHPRKAWLMNRFINAMMPSIIAPSDIVYQYITNIEHVPEKKMLRINYGYNFSQYDKPCLVKAASIRAEHPCELLIISIARLTPPKRHLLMFQAVKFLKEKELDVKMICLGDGPSRETLQQWIDVNGMNDVISLKGILPDIFDYLVAGDVLFHLSETEASNSVVKETGLVKRTAIVCRQVGDFSDYIENDINGFLLDKKNPLPEAIILLEKLYHNKEILVNAGKILFEKIIHEFDIDNVSSQYDELIQTNTN
ncbi:MAG: glycosyltransferase family 4 protein [Ferruginibacter sp.]